VNGQTKCTRINCATNLNVGTESYCLTCKNPETQRRQSGTNFEMSTSLSC
jgi:hypothetical protein